MNKYGFSQVCANTFYSFTERKWLACMGYMNYRKHNTELYCHLCGYTITLNRKDIGKI